MDAIVLITTANGKASAVSKAVSGITGVKEAYSVAGDVDVVAVVHAKDITDLARIIPDGIAAVEGVTGTKTLMAFQSYSDAQLDSAYDLGLD